MNAIWLHCHKHRQLILFFSGWASEHQHFRFLKTEDCDVLFCNDYRDDSVGIDMQRLTEQYESIVVIGWSLGVCAAYDTCLPWQQQISKAIAINGTLTPVDDAFGIPKLIFDGTHKNLSLSNLAKFNRRMFDNPEHHQWFAQHISTRTIDELKDELHTFNDVHHTQIEPFFDKVVVSTNDLIFTHQNQLRFWEEKADIQQLQSGHFPFYLFTTWDELAEL
jgi:pimeloyl-[acyl-carrier protein] methyl ester esterase